MTPIANVTSLKNHANSTLHSEFVGRNYHRNFSPWRRFRFGLRFRLRLRLLQVVCDGYKAVADIRKLLFVIGHYLAFLLSLG
jgi:hypothetical protein